MRGTIVVMNRIIPTLVRLLLLALMLVPADVAAQAPAGQSQEKGAPGQQSVGGLVFPATLAGAALTRTVDYAQPPSNDPRLGISYHYRGRGPVDLSIYLYDGGQRVPDGAADPVIRAQFAQADREIALLAAKTGRYAGLSPVPGPETCRYGALDFRCVTYTAERQDGLPIYTRLLLGGWRRQFVKIRLDWPRDRGMERAGEEILDAFIAAQSAGKQEKN